MIKFFEIQVLDKDKNESPLNAEFEELSGKRTFDHFSRRENDNSPPES